MIWREKRILLGVLGVLLLANTVFFFTYRVQYERRLQDLDNRLHASEARLIQARSTRMAAERRVTAYQNIQKDIRTVYNEQWSTEAERLTALITEIKRLTVASELIPGSISFTRQEGKKELTKAAAPDVVTINFSVKGNYQQVRRLINLLELSRQFVIIDQISLSSANDESLTLTLTLKTLFRNPAQQSAAKES